ncbi:hypothetical protein GOBAR_AA03876 [Gossypium barbadense]|uniref:Uncharacterized protein n=1 Tax=Gossypium barbadense TaxID=3634 RepID=A0A2P5YMC0_GOSBA|nr:hypothetical protein GOBAR_AA03876 [Gossypium barbadense]
MRSINSLNHHDHSMESTKLTNGALEYMFTTQTWPSTRACLGPCGNRAKVWRVTRLILETMAEPVNLTRAYDTPVQSNCGQTFQNKTGVDLHTWAWEKRTEIDTAVQHGRVLQCT